MSKEQANTFRKFRDADDQQGNLGWSARLSRKGMRQAPEFAADTTVEAEYGMSDEEKILWRLVKVPRKYIDLENLGVLPAERVRGVMRGLVAADAVDIVEFEMAKPIVPLEVTRLRAKLKGGDAPVAKSKHSKLKARVYRPDIGLAGNAPEPKRKPAPAPVEVARSDEPKELSAEAKQLIELVEGLEKKLEENDHYAFLGVASNATAADIKKAYVQRARDLHPDRVMSSGAGANAKVRASADVLFKALQDVYAVLSDDGKRAEYDADGADRAPASTGPSQKQRRPEDARMMFKKGRHLITAKAYAQAHQHLKMAIDFDDRLMEAQVLAAWALYYREDKPEEDRTEKAKKQLRTLADHKSVADAAYRLSLIARMEEEPIEHEKRVKQAVRLDKNHSEAAQELRVLDRRRQTGAATKKEEDRKAGGLLGRFKR